jgi:hypothetical protein
MKRPRTSARLGRVAVVVVGVAAVALAAQAPAVAAPDVTPPVLKVPFTPAFVVPQQVHVDASGRYTGVKARISWEAHDPSGICGKERGRVTESGARVGTASLSSATHDTWRVTVDNEVGPDTTARYYVRALDCAGNAAEATVYNSPEFSDVGSVPEEGWREVVCTCAAAGSMLSTSTRGASVGEAFDSGTFPGHIAVVMTRGHGRGRAAIYLDGVRVKTVDTRATATSYQWLVWSHWVGDDIHTVRVVNLATPGRPRIDVDGFFFH